MNGWTCLASACALAAALTIQVRCAAVAAQTGPVMATEDDLSQALSVGGEWRTSEGTVKQDISDGTALLLAGRPDWNDYTARVRVRLPSDAPIRSEAGLVLQCRDEKNYIVFSLRQKEGGVFGVLRIQVDPGLKLVGDQVPLRVTLGEWHELRADGSGDWVLHLVRE